MSEQTERNQEVVRRWQEAYNTGNLDVVQELVAPDWVSNNWPEGLEQNLENLKALNEMLLGAFPDVQLTTEALVAEGDLVAQRWTWRGTHKGDFPGLPASGHVVEQGGMSMFRVVDGKIVQHWGYQDSLGSLHQMGAEFPAEWLAFIHH
jgi:steroid delta-isomerase-like uncharacterized protein